MRYNKEAIRRIDKALKLSRIVLSDKAQNRSQRTTERESYKRVTFVRG